MIKIKTLRYYGFYDINIDLFNLNDVVNYKYAYVLLGLLGRLNSLKRNLKYAKLPFENAKTFQVSLKRIFLRKILTQVVIVHH